MPNPRYELWCDRCGKPIRANFLALYCTRCAQHQEARHG